MDTSYCCTPTALTTQSHLRHELVTDSTGPTNGLHFVTQRDTLVPVDDRRYGSRLAYHLSGRAPGTRFCPRVRLNP